MSKRKLLLADDSVTIQKVVNLTFADEGIEVITVGDGNSAIERISQAAPDVVLADVHMPGLSGYRVCEIVRENPATKNIPVVLLVGSFEPFDENEAARVGANAYLTKPFQSIRQLVNQVSDLMQTASPTPPAEPEIEASPTAEMEAAPMAEPEIRDTTDIESLYQQSFGEPEPTSEESETGPPRYVDAGMDDEMIETSRVGEEAEPAYAETAMADAEVAGAEAAEEPAGEVEQPEQLSNEVVQPVSAFDSYADVDRSPAAVATAAAAELEPYFDQFANTEPIPTPDHQRTRGEFELDDSELLELPPIENGKTLEFTPPPQPAPDENKKEVVSVSPELLDVIVQRVVEKLSEKS